MEQINLFDESAEFQNLIDTPYVIDNFSAGNFCPQTALKHLENKYAPILELTDKFNRRSVSYQLSKKDSLHSWLKYKEGFSADLVNTLLDEMKISAGDTIIDPFIGSGTTALVCKWRGINSIGYDVMPLSAISITAKANVMKYNLKELRDLITAFKNVDIPDDYNKITPYITITRSAYPECNGKFIQFASEWIDNSDYSAELKNLFTLCIINSLERSSYTSKSGQYLSWDSRSDKVINANIERQRRGKKPFPQNFCRPNILNVKDVILDELNHVSADILNIQNLNLNNNCAKIDFNQKNALFALPLLDDCIVDGVITCFNRYDYTRGLMRWNCCAYESTSQQ